MVGLFMFHPDFAWFENFDCHVGSPVLKPATARSLRTEIGVETGSEAGKVESAMTATSGMVVDVLIKPKPTKSHTTNLGTLSRCLCVLGVIPASSCVFTSEDHNLC
ncbi:MAG: hypothetical protein QW780_02615 [Sulfolobales archaeon]